MRTAKRFVLKVPCVLEVSCEGHTNDAARRDAMARVRDELMPLAGFFLRSHESGELRQRFPSVEMAVIPGDHDNNS